VTLPEAPVQLELEEENAISQKVSSSSRIAQLMGGDQPDTSMTDIKPVEKLADKEEDAMSTTKSSGENERPTSTVSPTITPANIQKPTQSVATSNINNVTEQPQPPAMDVAKQQQVTIGKDGKKRIRPVFVTSGNSIHNAVDINKPHVNNDGIAMHHTRENGVHTNGNVHGTEYDSPSSYLPSSGIPTSVVGTKRKPNEEISDQDSVKRVDIDQNSTSEPLYRPSWIDAAIVPPIVRQSQLRLGVPKVKSVLTQRGSPHEPSWVLECQNSSNRGTNKHGFF
jgi:protein HIRA/HIR1